MMDENQVKTIVAEVLKHIDLHGRIKSGSISCGVSNRHLHVSQADLEILFGKGSELKQLKPLSQPGQFAAEETVLLVGPKGSIEKCRILGPVRPSTQVEVSVTDCFKLGVKPIVRDSGNTANTPGCVLVGPKGAVTLKEGVIVAARHIHISAIDAPKFGLKDMDRVSIKSSGPRSVVFNNVLVRVSDKFALDFHLDTDEANAAGISNGDMVEIVA
ncbi:MAG: phosphate propanoyltransferase [Candidatus Riflebacteria bacterium]|nr:phosphate propanoyltransferase [Candidatus Riflebacteria bacterium]